MNPLSLFYTLRSYVDSYAGLLGRRFLSFIWLAALCIVVWFYGYLIGYGTFKPLESATNRLIVIGIAVIAWAIYIAVSMYRARGRDKALADDLESDVEAGKSTEVDEIRARLKEALGLLRKVSRKRFGYIYELPWYVIFGAPGSGKTTALSNSGLKFPLGDAMGANAVSGIGGTRNCNWWFAEEAILIDTAGRYTTQDDINGTAKAGWEGFLNLIRKHRRSQPVNGALVTLSIADLMQRDPDAMREELRAVRQRLSELDSLLDARIPVYILLTKADLLTGFIDFFDGFSRSDREQVWGMTFPLNESQNPSGKMPDRFLEEYALLQERVDAMLLERLQQEPDIETRGRIFRFPAELAALRDRLREAVEELSSGSQFMEPPFIRGIYLASGTQSSTQAVRERRSYFLPRLFRDVIFEEAALVSHDKRLSRRQRIIRNGALATAGAVLAIVLVGWIGAYFQNKRAIAEAEDRIDNYERLAQGIPVTNVNDTDFLRVLPALDSLRNVTAAFDEERPLIGSFGLSQESKLAGRQQIAYRNALNGLLLPRLLVHLQRTLDNGGDVNSTFDALKLYGMLGGLGPVDRDFVAVQAEDMFARLYPGDTRASIRQSLAEHVENLASGVIDPINLDDARIAAAREKIRDVSIAARAFNILVNRRDARKLPSWLPAEPLGPLGEQAFERKSGSSWRDGIPGIYTQQGYHQVVLPYAADAVQEALNEGWVRGGAAASGDAQAVDVVSNSVLQQYYDAFRKRWQDMLTDIRTRRPQSLGDAAEIARVLANRPSPVESIARSIAVATDLHGTMAGQGVSEAAARTLAIAGAPEIPSFYEELRAALKTPDQASTQEDSAQETPGSQIVGLTPLMQALYGQLSRAATSTAEVARVFDVDSQLNQANQALIKEARQLPAPLDSWIAGMTADISTLVVDTARANIRDQWSANNRQFCASIVEGRYPFDRSSQRDVAMSDFVRLFGPSGILQTFFKERVEPFVDTGTSPWRWRGTFGADGQQSQAIAQFENADRIRRAFFPAGAEKPSININIRPVSLSPSANAVMLEIEGERVVYFHGPIQAKSVAWPSEQSANLSRVAFQPGGWQQALTVNGDWSPFRLFDQATLTREDGDSFRARFANGQFEAEFDVQFGSVMNPFRLKALSDFSCPEQF
ncbi:type VI secretion protein IcmF [Brucella endophytica]|uniref:Type VI secretion protein IcmF n=1 Tax=Brucella endophytica TaxID=1963359 RepID=A0A916SA66_9HYPH|nr:type VI secretion system membrane subunit TssM [Brucella endophytica]GGA88246.1 type VI secretion protein IcmF [Brucella endophytica]